MIEEVFDSMAGREGRQVGIRRRSDRFRGGEVFVTGHMHALCHGEQGSDSDLADHFYVASPTALG